MMQCLKCGKEVKNEQVFCAQCLEVMDAYPVKPDVHIQLPKNRELVKKPAKKRRPPSPEEQVIVLRRKNRRLIAALLVLVLLLGATVYLLVRTGMSPEDSEWGKNYTFEIPFN